MPFAPMFVIILTGEKMNALAMQSLDGSPNPR
jgi:hypothetical protein